MRARSRRLTAETQPSVEADAPKRASRVGDLVAVDVVRTVVRMADLDDPALMPELVGGFVMTADAEHCIRTILRDVAAGRGRGYFLEGAFGSGKSHLLAVLQGLAAGRLRPDDLGSGLAEGRGSALGASDLPSGPLLCAAVSLVEFSAEETLEQAVLSALARACPADLGSVEKRLPRREAFAAVAAHLERSGRAGVFLCVDELSEFLRSKPDGRAFAEDVRFLQFLGEWAESAPAWILCSAQEAIEQTGELPAPTFGRIRDRYPVRFHLGGGHVKELIARRLIRRLPEAGPTLRSLHAGLRRTFGTLPFGEDEFARLYPVHPATVDLLDQLRPLFSQQRGVIDFIVSRLRGDPARRIPGLLDQPADRLLGPETVAPHFRDRIRERPETAAFATVAMPYFETEMPRLFDDPESARVARAAGMLLVAGALCPTPRAFTAREVADALLYRLTDLDPEANVEFIAGLLDRIASQGAYVAREDAEPAGGPAGAAVRYRCDLEADLSLVVARRLDYWRSGLLPDDGRVWTALLPWCEDGAVPLHRLTQQPRSTWEVSWRRSPRKVGVWLTQVSALDPADLREAALALETSETDVQVLMTSGYPGEPEAAVDHWDQMLAPVVTAMRANLPVLLWVPRPPTAAESGRLRELVGYALLDAELAASRSAISERLAEHLRQGAAARRGEAALLYREMYLQGTVYDAGRNACAVGRLDGPAFATLLEQMCDAPLHQRFPRHPELPARPELFTPAAAERATVEVARSGEADPAALDAATRQVLDQFLLPLGLVRRSARGYRLTLEPRSGLASDLLDAVEGCTPAQPLALQTGYLRLRKGEAGIAKRVFELLCFAMVQSGAVSAVRGGRRLPPGQVRLQSLWEVEGLAPGALVDPTIQGGLESLPFLPPRLRRGPLTYTLQREAWEAAVEWKRRWTAALPGLRDELRSVREFPSLQSILAPDLVEELDRLEDLLGHVLPSLAAQEGLQRVLEAFAARPLAPRLLQRADELQEFVKHRMSTYMHMVSYLDSPDMAPPPELQPRVDGLRALLHDAEAMLGEGYAEADGGFAKVQQAYIEAYTAAHDAAVGPQAFLPYDAIRQSAAFRVAVELGDIPGLTADPDAVGLRRAVEGCLAARCDVAPPVLADRLRRIPFCECGFRPGAPPDLPAPKSLRDQAEACARGHVAALGAPDHAERIRSYAAGLEAVGRKVAAQALVELLEPGADQAPLEDLRARLQAAGLAEVRAALAGRALVMERDLAGLLQPLTGRAVRPEQVLDAVRGWIGQIPAGTFVRVVDRDARATPPPRRLTPPVGAQGQRPRVVPDGPFGDPSTSARPSLHDAEEAVAALRSAAERPPSDPASWGALWLSAAGAAERVLAESADAARRSGDRAAVSAVRRWSADLAEAHVVLRHAFGAELARGAPRDGALAAAVERARALRSGSSRPPGLYVWCVDGLRCDLLDLVLETVRGQALRERERGVGWAVSPTVTAAQFEALGAIGFRGELVRWSDGVEEALSDDPAELLAEVDWMLAGEADGCICKWDFVDRKVHGSGDDYATFCAEVRLHAARRLRPAFEALRPGEVVVLCSDHGFRTAPPAAASGPRYAHGGDSPDEVLAPWVVLTRERSHGR